MKTKNITTLLLRNSIGRSPLRLNFLLIPLALALFGLLPAPKAFGVSPPPDGGYPGANTAEGQNALHSLTTGGYNTAIGYEALYNNYSGTNNTANGNKALYGNDGDYNTATGVNALYHNDGGSFNTATGFQALFSSTNTFLYNGSYNTATGVNALYGNGGGSFNTAAGYQALYSNSSGNNNTANGAGALYNNCCANSGNYSGSNNTATGVNALHSNFDGADNTATGAGALYSNTTGFHNIALGFNAGFNLTEGNNNIDIGNVGVARESDKIRIGTVGTQTATFIAGIHGVTVASGVAVIVGSNGQLGTVASSERFKDEIKPMDKASEAILALKPVTFHYKPELDPEGVPQFGLVAEQVEKVNPDLVARDGQGKVFTVRYEAVNAMLLNEFLKEHRTVQELKSTAAEQATTIAQQQKEIQALTASLKEQASQIEKVSAQLELRKPAPRTVAKQSVKPQQDPKAR